MLSRFFFTIVYGYLYFIFWDFLSILFKFKQHVLIIVTTSLTPTRSNPLPDILLMFCFFLCLFFLLFGCLLAWLIWGLKNLVWFGCLWLFLLFMWLLCLLFSTGDSSVHICIYEIQADYWSQYREAKASCILQSIATSPGPMSGFWFPICSLLGLIMFTSI